MHSPGWKAACCGIVAWTLGVLCAQPLPLSAQEPPAIIGELMEELQIRRQVGDRVAVITWMPLELWQELMWSSFAGIPDELWENLKMGEGFQGELREMADQAMSETMGAYSLFLVAEATIGNYRDIHFSDKQMIIERIRLVDQDGIRHPPMVFDELPEDVRDLAAQLEAKAIGAPFPLGGNMHLVIFPAYDDKGRRVADPKGDGKLLVVLGKTKFKWKLPIESLAGLASAIASEGIPGGP